MYISLMSPSQRFSRTGRPLFPILLCLYILSAPMFSNAEEPSPRVVSDLWLPAASLFLPGFGQYLQGDFPWGAGYSLTAVGGVVLAINSRFMLVDKYLNEGPIPTEPIPKSPEMQGMFYGLQLYQTAGFLSAYQVFAASVPSLQERGHYRFLPNPEGVGDLLVSPFRLEYLKKPTTYIPLGLFTALAGLAVSSERGSSQTDNSRLVPYHFRDALFTTGVSFNAGVSEEAFFRGYALPWFYQAFGERWFFANGMQAAAFGLAHYNPENESTAIHMLITGTMGYYFGSMTRRNDWNVGEAIFLHFWWDIVAFTAGYLTLREIRFDFSFKTSVPL